MKKIVLIVAMAFTFFVAVYLAALTAETGNILTVGASLGCLGVSGILAGNIDEEYDEEYEEPWWIEQN